MRAEQYYGQIAAFAGDYETRPWVTCDGRKLRIDQNRVLFEVLGTKYGGDGKTDFALPKLQGPMGGIRYLIALQGLFPPPPERREPFVPDFIGMMTEWDGPRLPEGTERADGRLVAIAENDALFNVLGNRFGGNINEDTFALPNLGGKWIIALYGRYPVRA